MTEEIKDETTEVIETTPDDDKTSEKSKGDEKGKDGALSDVDKKTAEKTQAVQSVLDEYDIDSPEQLSEFLKSLSGLKDQLGDVDLEELQENSALLKKYQRHWAKEEEDKKEDGETPEETIARLKKENSRVEAERNKDREAQERSFEAGRVLKTFTSTVKSSVEANKDVPVEYQGFLKEFLGVGNEINEVDIYDKAGVKRIAKAGAKKLQEFEQLVIKRYLKGKTETPKISPSAETSSKKPVQFKSEKQAKAAAVDRLKSFFKK